LRSLWLFIPFSAVNAAVWVLWSAREWEGSCVDYVNGPGRCRDGSAYIVWTDTVIAAAVVALVLPIAALVLWRRAGRSRKQNPAPQHDAFSASGAT
jgi:hypothetical protein